MSDDDIFEEAREESDDDVTTEIKLDDVEIVKQSSPPRTSVTQISPVSRNESNTTKSGQFIDISVDFPEKHGSGMSSYFIYKVTTKTNKPSFLRQEMCVRRRFSDFLGLHSRLQSKYISTGFIVPAAPEKNAIGNTKVIISKEDQSNSEFIARRRSALERFLRRIARHSVFVIDSDFREFLEDEKELPKAVNTQMFSGTSVKKLFKNVGGMVGNMAKKIEDCDQWFDNKQVEMDSLERHFNQIHSAFDQHMIQKRELVTQTKLFAQACSQLSHVEEHTSLAQAMAHLSLTKEEIGKIEEKDTEVEMFEMIELLKDYLGMIGSVKEVLNERMRQYRLWQDEVVTLSKKREQKERFELSNKVDKIPVLEAEIRETEIRVQRSKEDFDKISNTIKNELETFDTMKMADFKRGLIKMLESMLKSEESVVEYWEKYGQEVAGISL